MVSWHKGFWAVVVLGVGIAAGTAYLLMPKTDEKPTGRDDSAVPTQLSRRLYAEGIDCAPESEASTHNSLAVNPKNPNVIYVGVEGRGVFKSIDRGATWQRITNGIAVYPDKDWPDEPCFYDIGRIVIDPADPEHLLMAITDMSSGYIDWPYAQTGGVWESFDGGTSWRQILTGELNAAGTGALAFDPTNPKVIYFGVNSDYPTFSEAPIRTTLNRKGILYKTADGGRTWEELPTGVLTGTQGVAVFIDAENPDNLWLFTQSHDHIQLGGGRYIEEPIAEQYGPMRSSDGGKTWESLAERLPPERRLIFDGDVAKHNFRRLIVRSFHFGTRVPPDTPQKSFYSHDGGDTFHETDRYIHVGRYNPHDKTGNHIIGYAPWQDWIIQSKDGGASWRPLGAPGEISRFEVKATNFVWDPLDPETVYMSGTKGYVWQSTNGGKTWRVILSLSLLPK